MIVNVRLATGNSISHEADSIVIETNGKRYILHKDIHGGTDEIILRCISDETTEQLLIKPKNSNTISFV